MRETDKRVIMQERNIGQSYCKFGDVEHSYFTGTYIFGRPHHLTHRMKSFVKGYLEGFNPNSYQIKLRMNGWSYSQGSAPHPINK